MCGRNGRTTKLGSHPFNGLGYNLINIWNEACEGGSSCPTGDLYSLLTMT